MMNTIEFEIEPPRILREYAAREDGVVVLQHLANCIEMANSVSPSSWGTTLPSGGKQLTLNVGPIWSITLHPDRITIALLAESLDSDVKQRLIALDKWNPVTIPEISCYELPLEDAPELLPRIEAVRYETIRSAAGQGRRAKHHQKHDNAVIDFLSRELELDPKLPQPDYHMIERADSEADQPVASTEEETEGLALLKSYAEDADGRLILSGFAESIRVANTFQRTQWVPTARPLKGWTVNLRTGQIYALTLRRDGVQVLLLPEMLRDEERKALEEAAPDKYEPKHPPGSARYTLDLAAARKLWGSIERAHHAVLQQGRHPSGAKNNPEADALIDYLSRELELDLPYPDRALVGANGKAEEPAMPGRTLLEAYAASDEGKTILRATAESIEVANSVSRTNWGTTANKNGTYVALNIGNACAIRLHADRVRILLLPDRLDAEVRKALEDRSTHSWARAAIPGAQNYEVDWPTAAQMWESLQDAHHAILTAARRGRTSFHRSHSNTVIDFLNRELGLELPYPGYRTNPDGDGLQADDEGRTAELGRPQFRDLVKSIEVKGLHFPTETVANYILALQTKRFAILTGISGTGKTQIAMSVAQSFQARISDRLARIVDEDDDTGRTVKMTARPYHFRLHELGLPVAFVRHIDPALQPPPGSNGGEIGVSYPGGQATLKFYRDPTPTKNQTSLWFREAAFREWYTTNLQPGDQFYISFRGGEQPDQHRIEFRLPDTRVTKRRLDNYTVVPVRPDWVDNRGLLGYLNPITGAYSTTPFLSLLLEAHKEEERADKEERHPHPFFVVLDEMNLARVEHYFSDFLSALESDEPIPLHDDQDIEDGAAESGVPVPRQLWIPKNVFFTGTVNVDETTYMFSPKVLDRAFTIEFDRVDLAGYTAGVARSEAGELDLSADTDGALRFTPYEKPDRGDWLEFTGIARGRYARVLRELHAILEGEHRHFGYRVANEIARFVNLAREQSADGDEAMKAAFDLALRQKVLPKFHGTQQELEPLLERLFNFAVLGGERRRGDTDVSLDDWRVVDGRLTPKGRAASSTDVPARTSESVADGSVDETEGPGSENETDAGAGTAEGRDPELPRTAAKIWRMLKRLEQRGFAAFIE
ncbi:hypothetical protein [Candidatus Palauibacter sp.]|uniref:hypothetical protein n=1 Tax=Candidatus Palauibacter sp. TaxID=3101350 RepID=UPI003B01E8A8